MGEVKIVRYDTIQQGTLMTEEIEAHVLEQYQVVKKIGSGAYGHVWKVIERKTKAVKALKKNFDAFSNSTDAQRTYREIMFLRQLRHPNIVNLERTMRARNDRDIYLVFQHMDVDLHTLIREDGKSTNLEERHKQYIIYQIAKAIYLLHNCNLIHRDLKPSNVLINESCEAKLCDFGLVRFMEEPEDNQTVVMTDYIATRWYRAPELLLGCKDYSKQVDIWALGCLVGELFLGKAMFPGTSTSNQLEKVLSWTGAPSSAELKQISAHLNPAILQMLNQRKKLNRADFFQGKVSPLCLDLVSKMLEFDPSKRLSIEQVLKHEYLSEFYNEKEMKEIKAARIKIQLHINDNKKLSLKDYRQLIYSQINRKEARVLNSLNTNAPPPPDSNSPHFKSRMTNERPKKDLSKQKSKLKTQPVDHTESTHSQKNHTVYQSTEPKDENGKLRKDVKSSLQRSVKSRAESRKKGISICSKSMSKNNSLSKKKYNEIETVDVRDLRKIKPYSRSCNQKQDKIKRMVTQQSKPNKRVLLTNCYINENIGRKVYVQDK